MIVVTRERFLNRTVYYRKQLDSAGAVLESTRYDCKVFLRVVDGVETIFILDKDDMIRPAPFFYVNTLRVGKPINTRLQMATALQAYYTFCDIYSYNPKDLHALEAERFVRFLTGIDVEPEEGSASRYLTVETVKSYIGLIRKFLKLMKYNEEGFENSEDAKTVILTPAGKSYRMNVRTSSISRELKSDPFRKYNLPKHLTPDQAKDVFQMMVESNDVQMQICFRLGFGEGLRRGEILGLAIEDFVEAVDPETGELVYKVLLRNRTSDDSWQNCKTLKHPSRRDHYFIDAFKRSIHSIEISKSLYDQVQEFYAESRDINKLGAERYKALMQATRADSWNSLNKDTNYLFFNYYNGQYGHLSGNTFNNRLKGYFKSVGVELDNVSHALRHSFAIFHAHYASKKMDITELQILMRHASIESTKVYYNLTDKEKRELRSLYNCELNNLIPEFK